MTLSEYAKLPGVVDLPMRVRAKFIAAIKAEDEGNHELAASKLEEAVTIEQELKLAAK